ncbi:YugN-like family protein [Bacillus subtilis subsp. subtilis]|nr:YugN-like family protein [Bacillus subtilis subsp. subtilis]
MIPKPSAIDGQSFLLQELVMKPLGYVVNGGWEYDHGYFDYKIDDRDGYLFLRVPVNAVQGSLDERGAAVRIGTPFMLRQVLQTDVDDQAEGGPFQSLFNQFSEPERRDAEIDPAFLDIGASLVKELEDVLLH